MTGYTPEQRRADTLKHIEFMASLNMLDKISPGQLATTYHGMTKFQVEAEMVKHMPEGGEVRLTVRHVQETVAEHFEVPLLTMTSPRGGGNNNARPRHIAMFLARKLCLASVRAGNQGDHISYPALGRIFKRDHTTIIYAERKVENLIRDDSKFAAEINTIASILGENQAVEKWGRCPSFQHPQVA